VREHDYYAHAHRLLTAAKSATTVVDALAVASEAFDVVRTVEWEIIGDGPCVVYVDAHAAALERVETLVAMGASS
jgi:hypothetical protein